MCSASCSPIGTVQRQSWEHLLWVVNHLAKICFILVFLRKILQVIFVLFLVFFQILANLLRIHLEWQLKTTYAALMMQITILIIAV